MEKRNYTHVQALLSEIRAMLAEGKTQREVAEYYGFRDKQVVKLQTFTTRPTVFEDVVVRISPDFAAAVHLDYDEANACGFQNGDLGRILP